MKQQLDFEDVPRKDPESGLMFQQLKKVPVTQNNPRCPIMPTGHVRNAMYATIAPRGKSSFGSGRRSGGTNRPAFSSMSG